MIDPTAKPLGLIIIKIRKEIYLKRYYKRYNCKPSGYLVRETFN